MKPIETVGILGLGKMGGPIAGHLVARGFKVIGYDPVARAREQAAARGARGAASARELAQASDLVIVLEEADRARLSLPLAGTVKETIKGLKIRMGLSMPEIPEHL